MMRTLRRLHEKAIPNRLQRPTASARSRVTLLPSALFSPPEHQLLRPPTLRQRRLCILFPPGYWPATETLFLAFLRHSSSPCRSRLMRVLWLKTTARSARSTSWCAAPKPCGRRSDPPLNERVSQGSMASYCVFNRLSARFFS
jgi:hypothetical protein